MEPTVKTPEMEQLQAALVDAKFTEFSREEIEGKQVFVASDETVDREGDVISIDGWQLDNFKRNPVMLWAHNPYEPPIGRWTNIRMRTIDGKKKLTMEPDFHRKSELSKLIADLVADGYPPQTTSVGFRPYQKEGNRFTKQELLETSFVNIPANPEATTLALSKGYSLQTIGKLLGTPEEGEAEVAADPEPEPVKPETPPAASEEEVKALTQRIERLEVALQGVKPATAPAAVPGRRQSNLKRCLQIANKALDEALRLQKL